MPRLSDYLGRDDLLASDNRDGIQALVDDVRFIGRMAVQDEVKSLPPMFQQDIKELNERLQAVERRVELLYQEKGRLPA